MLLELKLSMTAIGTIFCSSLTESYSSQCLTVAELDVVWKCQCVYKDNCLQYRWVTLCSSRTSISLSSFIHCFPGNTDKQKGGLAGKGRLSYFQQGQS